MADFLVTMDRAGRDCHGSRSRYRLDRVGMAEVNGFFFARDLGRAALDAIERQRRAERDRHIGRAPACALIAPPYATALPKGRFSSISRLIR